MITPEAQRIQVLNRLRKTRPNETICLWGWETEVLLNYIDELKRGRMNNGSQEVQEDDSEGTDAGARD